MAEHIELTYIWHIYFLFPNCGFRLQWGAASFVMEDQQSKCPLTLRDELIIMVVVHFIFSFPPLVSIGVPLGEPRLGLQHNPRKWRNVWWVNKRETKYQSQKRKCLAAHLASLILRLTNCLFKKKQNQGPPSLGWPQTLPSTEITGVNHHVCS